MTAYKKRFQPVMTETETALINAAVKFSIEYNNPTGLVKAGGLMLAEMIVLAADGRMPVTVYGHEIKHLLLQHATGIVTMQEYVRSGFREGPKGSPQ